MAKIFVSVPVLGRPELKMMYSMYQAIYTCKEHQIRLFFNENDSLISRVRNAHISSFLNDYKDCDYFMSLDSDLEIVNCYPGNNIFTKLVSHNLDFVGGIYALKREGPPRSASIAEDLNANFKFDSGLREMKWLSSGCWCLKRSAVERMAESYPDLIYDGDDNMSGKKLHGLYIPFVKEITLPNGNIIKKYLSEDWAYCARWKDIGGQIFADTSIVLRHIGQYPFSMFNVSVEPVPQTPPPLSQDDKKSIPEHLRKIAESEEKHGAEVKHNSARIFPNSTPRLPKPGYDLNQV